MAFPSTTTESPPQDSAALERGLLIGIVALRWAVWLWMVVIITYEVINRRGDRLISDIDVDRLTVEYQLDHPGWAIALVALAGAFTMWASAMLKAKPSLLLRAEPVIIELLIGGALLAFGEWIYGDSRHTQTLASAWPVVGVIMAGMVFGRRWGVIAGVWLGLSAYAQVPLPHGKNGEWSASIVSSMALYCAAGWAAGYLMHRLREAELKIASAKAREEVARTLHDGVLQTLAVIQRRSDDGELASMAREQEVELRRYLTGATATPESLPAALREAAAKHESRYQVRVQVVVADDFPTVTPEVRAAISGAVGEALTNASKHGEATSITIFAEPTDEDGVVFCSIKDDGKGFDIDSTAERIGTSRSIKGRLAEIGGQAEISSRVGRGTEVRLWAGGSER